MKRSQERNPGSSTATSTLRVEDAAQEDAPPTQADKNNRLGIVSGVLTYLLLAAFVAAGGEPGMVVREIAGMLTGSWNGFADRGAALLSMVPVLLTVVAIKLPVSMGFAAATSRIVGKYEGGHAVSEGFDRMPRGRHFTSFFLLCVAEELFARWFFLGLLAKIPFLSGDAGFGLLFLVGNGLWAYAHVANFKDKNERQTLHVLPQFIGGIFYTYVFMKYGLLASVLTHFASNAVLFSVYKVQKFDRVDVAIIAVAAVSAVAGHLLLTHPLAELAPWFAHDPVFVIPGWSFRDYFGASLFIESIVTVVSGLLLLDRGNAGVHSKSDRWKDGVLSYAVWMVAVVVLWVAGTYALFALLGFVVDDVPTRVLMIAIVSTFIHKAASGSALTRTFYTALPTAFLSVCTMQALGFAGALAWITLGLIVSIPEIVLTEYDD